jgi:hypothetical protein
VGDAIGSRVLYALLSALTPTSLFARRDPVTAHGATIVLTAIASTPATADV